MAVVSFGADIALQGDGCKVLTREGAAAFSTADAVSTLSSLLRPAVPSIRLSSLGAAGQGVAGFPSEVFF